MTTTEDSAARRVDAPPWEQQCRPIGGNGRFSDSKSVRAAIEAHGPSCGTPPSRVDTGARSGKTRRGVVYEYISAHPGAHVRGIANGLHLATGDLQYHIFWLEKHGFVKTRRSGFYRFVYPAMVFQEGQEVLLGVLTQETPREILLCLLHDPTITQGGLARSLRHSQPTISWHLERLLQSGLVSKKRTGGGMFYQVVADPDEILSFVKTYHPSVWKRWADRLRTAATSEEGRRGIAGMPVRRPGLMPTAVVKLIGNG